MQVRELIEELNKLNEDAEIEVDSGCNTSTPIYRIYKARNRNVAVIEPHETPE